MSAVAVICYLTGSSSGLTAQVPAARIHAGDVKIGETLPAITIKTVSNVPRLPVKTVAATVMHTERVQVTVYVKDTDASPGGSGYPQLEQILALVRAACPNTKGSVAGVKLDSVLPDIEGPDISIADPGMLSRSIDFIVRWTT